MNREEKLARMLNDKSVIAASNVTKAILALDDNTQERIENYLEQKKDNCFPPTLRIIDSIGGLSKQERNIIDDLDSLDQKSQWAIASILKDKEILFGKRTA